MSNGMLLFLNMGGSEIMVILAVVLLLFGGKKLPELARGLGRGIREFKDASEGVKREIHRNINAVDLDEDLNLNDNSRHHPETKPTGRLDQIENIDEVDLNPPYNTNNSNIDQQDQNSSDKPH